MRRLTTALIGLTMITTVAAGCAGPPKTASPEPRSTIRITGSLTCLPLLKLLAAEYQKAHPEITFLFLTGAHSSAGIQGARNGTLDIGAVSRDLTAAEKAGLEYRLVSNDGLVVAASDDVGLTSVSSAQIISLYSGATINWRELGGPDSAIVVLDRAEDESAKIILRQYVLGKTPVVSSASIMFLESDMIKALETTPNAIGYLSFGACVSESLKVNVLRLDGATPSVAAIHAGTYKMVRPLGVLLKRDPSAAVRAFVYWMRGADAKAFMDKRGYASPN
jgi:phosphate transport system substrate-binding protein